MGDTFLSKSFLFEIVDSATENILESFTLVLPPQSYSIKEKQRVNITKTFGNAFIDDYGPDNLELTIKGISGTAHVFPTFQTKGASQGSNTFATAIKLVPQSGTSLSGKSAGTGVNPTTGYRHKEAFYYFRDKIMRYKDQPDYDKKEMRVYDLADNQAYKCVLLEFSVDRSADKPLHYPFTISLFVYARFGSKNISKAKSIKIGKNPLNALDNLLIAMNSLDKNFPLFKAIQKIKNQVARVTNQIALLRAKFNNWLTKGRSILESPLILTKQVIEGLTELAGIVYDSYKQGKMLVDDYVNATETIRNQIRESLALYGYAIQEGSQQSKTAYMDTYTGIDYLSVPSTPSPMSARSSFSYSGLNYYTVKGEDTLQSIAQAMLGDESLWPYIASVNDNIISNNDLVVGEEIYVPVANDNAALTKDTFILTEDTQRDPYGADIRLDSDGNMVLQESNDVALISGIANVLQSVDVRLKTQVGSMIKQTAFGLMSGVGMAGTDAALSYVKMNLQNSLIQDPRIIDVSNIKVRFNKDSIELGADIKLVGMDTTLPVYTTL